jgi:hypothetical protein
MIHIPPTLLIPVFGIWLLFAATAVPANIVWFRIYKAVGSKELSTWYRNPRGWHLRVVSQFREKVEHEPDPVRRASMESLLRAWQILYRLCNIFLLAFGAAALALLVATAIRAAA